MLFGASCGARARYRLNFRLVKLRNVSLLIVSLADIDDHYQQLVHSVGCCEAVWDRSKACDTRGLICQVRWINAILVWLWQRSSSTGAGATRPEIVDTWLRAMTDEADKQAVS